MPLAPVDLAAAATQVSHALGATRTFEVPGDAGAAARIVSAVRALLGPENVGDPALREVVDALDEERRRGWSDPGRARRLVSELQALFDRAAFRRTKRAERGRSLAQLVALLDLEPALGVAPSTEGGDAEQHLKRIRRNLRAPR